MQAAKKRKKLRGTLAAAVAHPLRVKALVVLAEREASPAEIARELGVEVSKVGYHVTALAEANLIELVRTEPVRGALEHFYKACVLPAVNDQESTEMSDEDRRRFLETIVGIFAANAANALETGLMFARPDYHLTRVSMNVDEEGWSELSAAYIELYERAYEIKEASAERMAETDEKPLRVVSFQGLFETPSLAK